MKYLFIVLLAIICCAFGLNRHKTTLETEHFKGKVKSCVEKDYEMVYKGQAESDSVTFTQTRFFNEDGNVTKGYSRRMETYVTDTMWAMYDSPDKVETINLLGGTPRMKSAMIVRYDNNKHISTSFMQMSGPLGTFQDTSYYNNTWNLIEVVGYSEGEMDRKSTFEYDDKGNNIEMKCYTYHNRLWYDGKYKYNNEGNIVESEVVNYQDSTSGHGTFEYEEIDAKGNWLKRIELKDGKPVRFIKREIEYY